MRNEEEKREQLCACTLGRLFAYEPRLAKSVVDALGSARAAFDLDKDGLREITGPYSKLLTMLSEDELGRSERILERLPEWGAHFVPYTDPEYPGLLRECEDAPAGLYVRSRDPLNRVFASGQAVAVVGTRDISPYGREWCERIVDALAGTSPRPVVVSGLAIGVDVTAHLRALSDGLGTVAVLPTGIDDVYPGRHSSLASRVASTPGCALLTDFPPGFDARQVNFLKRNRIIAGLCGSTILVESKVRGGGMMTARLAMEYGRTVLALPGRVDDLRSGGCNYLLRQKVAEPLTDLESLPEQLGLGKWKKNPRKDLCDEVRAVFSGTQSPEMVELLCKAALLIRDRRGLTLEELDTEIPAGRVPLAVLAGMLEAEGFISVDLIGRCRILLY